MGKDSVYVEMKLVKMTGLSMWLVPPCHLSVSMTEKVAEGDWTIDSR